MRAVIEALAAAGVPSKQAQNIAADWLLGHHKEIADAEDADRLMIAADAPRILRVLLEARLEEIAGDKSEREALTRAVVDALWFRKEGDEDAVSLPVAIRAVLDLAAPVAGERVA